MNKIYINAAAFSAFGAGLENYFDARSLRRMDAFTKTALCAAAKCLERAGVDLKEEKDIALIIATGYGPVTRTCDFMNSIIDDGDECASPLAFSSSVHNAALTAVSILLNIKGPCLTVSNLETSFESAVLAARTWLAAGTAERVLLGAVDEVHAVVKDKFPQEKQEGGAAFFMLSKEDGVELPVIAPATPYNPSATAFALAKKLELTVTKKDVERIAADYIKTELARAGADIFSVFESGDAAALFKAAPANLRANIYDGLAYLFTPEKEIAAELPQDIVPAVYAKFKEHNLINFFTSGSTGGVTSCAHSMDMVYEEAGGLAPLFAGVKRVVSVVPASHSYGFIFGLMTPKFLGAPVLVKPPLPTLEWDKILRPGDLLVGFPLFFKQFLAMNFTLPQGVRALTSTAPCPDAVIDGLYKNGIENLIEIYGASEGGAFAYREKAGSAFTLLPYWDAHINGGRLERLTRKKTPMEVLIPDVIEITPGNRLRPAGRKDNAVQVAGINVFPQKVERVLKSFPPVADAAVRKMRPEEGDRLKAFVVLKPGFEEEPALLDLREFMKQNLTAHEMPRHITFGPRVPHTPFGKKKDW